MSKPCKKCGGNGVFTGDPVGNIIILFSCECPAGVAYLKEAERHEREQWDALPHDDLCKGFKSPLRSWCCSKAQEAHNKEK